jgi:hypothetical protein
MGMVISPQTSLMATVRETSSSLIDLKHSSWSADGFSLSFVPFGRPRMLLP